MTAINNRYDFVLFFDVENGNPNGDPDAGNMPRLDPETSHGLVTDVCLKRKVRNYVELTRGEAPNYNIYVREKAILNNENLKAYTALGIKDYPKAKLVKGDPKKIEQGRQWMCQNFYDVRTFGAVMSTEVNCGQVRGPVQLAFAKSIDPIRPHNLSITRMAATKEGDELEVKEKTMGSKFIVPYGLYRVHGFISAPLAERTGFSEADLKLFWEALKNMFEHDHSAARGEMVARKLFVFKHRTKLGAAPAHKLFDLIKVKKICDGPARSFNDYEIKFPENNNGVPTNVELDELIDKQEQ